MKLPKRDSETGSWFPVPSDNELPENLRKLFNRAREQLGFVPNVFRVWAYRPARVVPGSRTTANSMSRPRISTPLTAR